MEEARGEGSSEFRGHSQFVSGLPELIPGYREPTRSTRDDRTESRGSEGGGAPATRNKKGGSPSLTLTPEKTFDISSAISEDPRFHRSPSESLGASEDLTVDRVGGPFKPPPPTTRIRRCEKLAPPRWRTLSGRRRPSDVGRLWVNRKKWSSRQPDRGSPIGTYVVYAMQRSRRLGPQNTGRT